MDGKLLLVSDVHGNWEALQAVEADIAKRFKGTRPPIGNLGDLLGYGPNPRECVKHAATNFAWSLLGNHDSAALFDPEGFNGVAFDAIMWTREILEKDEAAWEFLGPLTSRKVDGNVQFVHGSPCDPTNQYVFPDDVYYPRKLEAIFSRIEWLVFAGHTHMPGIFTETGDVNTPYLFRSPGMVSSRVEVKRGTKALVNVGSVGQPRDGIADACYCSVEFGPELAVIEWFRVPYPVDITMEKILNEPRLDDTLAYRLKRGN